MKYPEVSYSSKIDHVLSMYYIVFMAFTFLEQCWHLDQKVKNNNWKVVGRDEGILGLGYDSSDKQWQDYKENIGILVALSMIMVMIRKGMENNCRQMHIFTIIFGVIVDIYTYRSGVLFILLFSMIVYWLSTQFYRSPQFFYIIHSFNFMTITLTSTFSPSLDQYLDSILGNKVLVWNQLFNLSLLRIISFGLEMHFSFVKSSEQKQSEISKHISICEQCQESQQQNKQNYCQKYQLLQYLDGKEFTLLHFWSHLFYFPCKFSGPILSFNHYIYQSNYQPYQEPLFSKQSIYKILKFSAFYFVIELMQYLQFSYAIVNNSENHFIFESLSIYRQFEIGIQNFIFMYVKFWFIWTKTQWMSQLAGVSVVGDMEFCVFQATTQVQFWRQWHRSFNVWNIRYIFIPLGGSRHYVRNLFIIFTYTSLWHEFNLSLLAWGYVLIIGMIVEHTASILIPQTKLYQKIRPLPSYKYYLSFVVMFSGTFLYISNNCGFGVGFKLFWSMICQWFNNRDPFDKYYQLITVSLYIVHQMYLQSISTWYFQYHSKQRKNRKATVSVSDKTKTS